MSEKRTLQVNANGEREVIMTRSFNAPREMVFEAWTRPELLKRWLTGPPGWIMAVCDVDFTEGGVTRFLWRGPNGDEMGLRMIGREFDPPNRIVSIEKFDEPWYPGEAQVTLDFTEHNGVTTITTTIRYESQAARDGVLKTPMASGVAMSYDHLETLLGDMLATQHDV